MVSGRCRWLRRDDWPEAIKNAWEEALKKPRPRRSAGRGRRRQRLPPLDKRSEKFQEILVEAISFFLGWQTLPERRNGPQLACSADDFEAYADYLEARVAPATAVTRVSGLVIALRAIGAPVDEAAAKLMLRYLRRKAGQALAIRQEHLRDDEIESEVLFHLGIAIMDMAANTPMRNQKFASAMYRDGLLIAWMSIVPARRMNFVKMQVDDLKSDGEQTFVIANHQKVADHDAEVIYLPEELDEAMAHYREVHRPRLLGANEDHGKLWVSYRGTELEGRTMSLAFARRTAPYGKAVRPHALRHRGAQAAGNARRAAQLLGNTPTIVRRNYRKRDRTAAMEVNLAKLDQLLKEAAQQEKPS